MTASHRNPESDIPETPAAPPPRLYDQLLAWLDANDWSYQRHEGKDWVWLPYTGESGTWRVVLDTFEGEDSRRLLVFSIYPVFVPPERRAAVAEAIARLNYGTNAGSFELDLDDGELRFKSLADTGGAAMPDALIERTLLGNLYWANRCFAPLLGIAFGKLAPESVKFETAAGEAAGTLQ